MPPRKHMRDICKVGILDAKTVGPEPDSEFTYGTSTRCRIAREDTNEIVDGDRRHMTNTLISLPGDVSVFEDSRIKLTKRNRGTLATPEYYRVMGRPWFTQKNRFIVCDCQEIPDGADSDTELVEIIFNGSSFNSEMYNGVGFNG